MKKQRKESLKYTEETTTTLGRRRTVKVKVNNEQFDEMQRDQITIKETNFKTRKQAKPVTFATTNTTTTRRQRTEVKEHRIATIKTNE